VRADIRLNAFCPESPRSAAKALTGAGADPPRALERRARLPAYARRAEQ